MPIVVESPLRCSVIFHCDKRKTFVLVLGTILRYANRDNFPTVLEQVLNVLLLIMVWQVGDIKRVLSDEAHRRLKRVHVKFSMIVQFYKMFHLAFKVPLLVFHCLSHSRVIDLHFVRSCRQSKVHPRPFLLQSLWYTSIKNYVVNFGACLRKQINYMCSGLFVYHKG